MTTKTKAANGAATAEDVAQSAPMRHEVPGPLAERIIKRAQAVDDAIAERDEMITLARELAGVSDAARLQPVPGGGLVWIEAKE